MCDTGFCDDYDDREARRDDHDYINDDGWDAIKEDRA